VCTLEAMIKSNENFPGDFEVNQRLMHLDAEGKHFENLKKSDSIGAISNEIFSL